MLINQQIFNLQMSHIQLHLHSLEKGKTFWLAATTN